MRTPQASALSNASATTEIELSEYYLILQLTIALTGVQLSDYHGVDSMTSFTIKGIVKGFVYTYGYFLSYFFRNKN